MNHACRAKRRIWLRMAQTAREKTENPRVGGSIPSLGTRFLGRVALGDWICGMMRGSCQFVVGAREKFSEHTRLGAAVDSFERIDSRKLCV
jgi:hypothetical protein